MHLRGEVYIVEDDSHLGVERGGSRVEVERSDETFRTVNDESFGVQAGALRAEDRNALLAAERLQFEQLHAGLQQRHAVVGVCAMHGGDIGGGERIGEHCDVDPVADEVDQRGQPLAAGDEVGRDNLDAGPAVADDRQQLLGEPVAPAPAEHLFRRIGDHAGRSDPVDVAGGDELVDRLFAAQPLDSVLAVRWRVDHDRKPPRPLRVEAMDRPGGLAVPVGFEDGRGLIDALAQQKHVEIAKIGIGGVEIGVADVAAADDGQPAVGDPRLGVHAARHGEHPRHQFETAEQAAVAHAARVEQAKLDVRMAVQRQVDPVARLRVDVVDQHPDADAALRRRQHLAHQQPAGAVVVPEVIHEVEGAFGGARRQHPRGERVIVVGDQQQPVLPRPQLVLRRQRDRCVHPESQRLPAAKRRIDTNNCSGEIRLRADVMNSFHVEAGLDRQMVGSDARQWRLVDLDRRDQAGRPGEDAVEREQREA